jgi:hypothetical protein
MRAPEPVSRRLGHHSAAPDRAQPRARSPHCGGRMPHGTRQHPRVGGTPGPGASPSSLSRVESARPDVRPPMSSPRWPAPAHVKGRLRLNDPGAEGDYSTPRLLARTAVASDAAIGVPQNVPASCPRGKRRCTRGRCDGFPEDGRCCQSGRFRRYAGCLPAGRFQALSAPLHPAGILCRSGGMGCYFP